MSGEADSWLVEGLYLWDLATVAPSPELYYADSDYKWWRNMAVFTSGVYSG